MTDTAGHRPRTMAAIARVAPFIVVPLILFAVFFHVQILDPTNVGWATHMDWGFHFLGWEAFRQDGWHWPLGKTNLVDWPTGNSVVYTDSNPLLAIPLKLISGLLPSSFQYIGPWFLACLLLHYFVAFKLLDAFVKDRAVALVGATLLSLLPTLYLRTIHDTLCAHWLILWALWIMAAVDRPQRRDALFCVLLCVTVLVHFYLLVMVLAVFLSDALRRAVSCARASDWAGAARLAATRVALLVPVALCMALAGYFLGLRPDAGGFGFYSMDLSALINPQVQAYSSLVRAFAVGPGQYEGFQYLGAGVILLALAALATLPAQAKAGSLRRDPGVFVWLAPAFAVLAILALSNKVTLHGRVLFAYPTARLDVLLGAVRSSGRLMWPVAYLLVALAVLGVSRLPRRWALSLMVGAIVVQAYDLRGVVRTVRSYTELAAHRQTLADLADPRWTRLIAAARVVDYQPPQLPWDSEDFFRMANRSVMLGRPITAMVDARPNPRQEAWQEADRTRFLQGELASDRLYVMADGCGPPSAPAEILDGVTLIAPAAVRSPEASPAAVGRGRPAPWGQTLRFDAGQDRRSCGVVDGWYGPEDWGTWTKGPRADLRLQLASAPAADVRVTAEIRFYAPAEQSAAVSANGLRVATLGPNQTGLVQFTVPAQAFAGSDRLDLTFQVNRPLSPKARHESDDARLLGLGLTSIRLDEAGPAPP